MRHLIQIAKTGEGKKNQKIDIPFICKIVGNNIKTYWAIYFNAS